MSELRQNLITRDWVIIATERATRPDQFANTKKLPAVVPPHRADCPFCVGNEEDGTLETCRLGDSLRDSFASRAGWKVRVTRAIASDVIVTVESCARSVDWAVVGYF
jgi:UDPglucose--hexose-1-phosphate uridylyltransferase